MTLGRLLRRSLLFHWRTGVVVTVALALATAVITGSLVLGDSLRGSLRETALARLGRVEQALVAPHLFRDALADEVNVRCSLREGLSTVAAVLRTTGAARNLQAAVAPQVTVWGVEESFWRLFYSAPLQLSGREVAVNASLARDLGLREGDFLLLTAGRETGVATDTLFARRGAQDTARSLRLKVRAVLPDRGVGGLRLDAGSAVPRNLFLPRAWLQTQLAQPGRANLLLVATPGKSSPAETAAALTEDVAVAATPQDWGLAVRPDGAGLIVHSTAVLLGAAQIAAVRAAARDCGLRASLSSVYLATSVRTAGPTPRRIAYAVVSGPPLEGRFRPATPGGPILGQREAWLNAWAAQDLGARVGDALTLSYLVPTWDGDYDQASLSVRVMGVVDTEGDGANPGLSPDFEGITNAKRIGDWDPPFPVDFSAVTPRDEQYWEQHRAAPKVFLNLDRVRAMWQSGPSGKQSDWVTGVRLVAPGDMAQTVWQDRFTAALRRRLAEGGGMSFAPVRAQILRAATGSTDFSSLMLGMSMFLVVAGVALAGMLLRLGADRRAAEAGLLLATGAGLGLVRRALLAEGAVLAGLGGLLGVPLGLGYAAALIAALTSWWSGALAETSLWLHVSGASLGLGALSGFLVGLAAAWWAARALGRRTARDLLQGWQALAVLPVGGSAFWSSLLLAGLVLGAAGAVVGSRYAAPTALFFAAGFLLLAAGPVGAGLLLRRMWSSRRRLHSVAGLALRSAAANRGRSLLVLGLLAAATFVIVAVAANARSLSLADLRARSSGSGGYSLLATSTLPLPFDPGTPRGRESLGFIAEQETALGGVAVLALRRSPGQDISCLNLSAPTRPRLLGVPAGALAADRFRVLTGPLPPGANPWALLDQPAVDGVLPAFGDADTVRWSLHSGLGQLYPLTDAAGRTVYLRFVGLLERSLFQGDLLVSAAHLRVLFPGVTAPSFFLLETPAGREAPVAAALREALGDRGLEVRTTAEVLNAYLRVQNTYLAMFLALGGLGLVLGSLGLVTVLLRNALERRGEFALLLATGFTRNVLARLLLLENAGLLLAGLGWGALAALVAVGPQLTASAVSANWAMVGGVLAAIVLVGVGASAVASRAATGGRLLAALREE